MDAKIAMMLRLGNELAAHDRPDIGRSTMYRGTADPGKVARRRAKNKQARKSRVYNARRNKK